MTKSFYFEDDKDQEILYAAKGLPQGSSLSPILFLITMQYISYFNRKGVKTILYADDISATICTENAWELPVLTALVDFLDRQSQIMGLKLNPNKTKIMAVAGSSYINKKIKRNN
ncbi:hypothetical protein ACOME3_007124 [Neoechinorhynchus agilis]